MSTVRWIPHVTRHRPFNLVPKILSYSQASELSLRRLWFTMPIWRQEGITNDQNQ